MQADSTLEAKLASTATATALPSDHSHSLARASFGAAVPPLSLKTGGAYSGASGPPSPLVTTRPNSLIMPGQNGKKLQQQPDIVRAHMKHYRNSEADAIDRWVNELSQYDHHLSHLSQSHDPAFLEELRAIEQWLGILVESEKTAALYTLVQHADIVQVRFLMAVLQQRLLEDPVSKKIAAGMVGGLGSVGNMAAPAVEISAEPDALGMMMGDGDPSYPRARQNVSRGETV
ncbi:hypothetical protein HDU93_003238 [Gonapodya sp. JEL0774]|nr:hypothetical protein HDU93_003238 [Gonapodya sp. JEL0774]